MLDLPSRVVAALATEALRGHPHETCGVLVGRALLEHSLIERMVRCPNLRTERAQDRYTLDPDAFRAADEDARADGLEILGIWHTHPDHPALPSDTDRQAAWEGWSYLILAVTRDAVVDWRSWRLVGTTFEEEPLRVSEEATS